MSKACPSKTVERSLVCQQELCCWSQRTGRWPGPQSYNLASFREFINNIDDAKWSYTIRLLTYYMYRQGTKAYVIHVQVENHEKMKFVYLATYQALKLSFPKVEWKLQDIRKKKMILCKWNAPLQHALHCATHLSGSNQIVFSLLKRTKHESEGYHPWPSKRWRGLPSATCIMMVTVNGPWQLKLNSVQDTVRCRVRTAPWNYQCASTMRTFCSPSLMGSLNYRQTWKAIKRYHICEIRDQPLKILTVKWEHEYKRWTLYRLVELDGVIVFSCQK